MNKTTVVCAAVLLLLAMFCSFSSAQSLNTRAQASVSESTSPTSTFSLVLTCVNSECSNTEKLAWKPPTDDASGAVWTSATFYVVYNSFTTSSVPASATFTFTEGTDTPNTAGFYEYTIVGSLPSTSIISFHIYGAVEFKTPHYVDGATLSDQNFFTSYFTPLVSAGNAVWASADIQHQWADDLLKEITTGENPRAASTDINFSPQLIDAKLPYLFPGQIGYQWTITFPQLTELPLSSIDVTLTGSNYFWVNSTSTGLDVSQHCTLNGNSVIPTVLANNTISVPLDSSIRSSSNLGQLLSLSCGAPSTGFAIVSLSTLTTKFEAEAAKLASNPAFGEKITIFPRFDRSSNNNAIYYSRGTAYSVQAGVTDGGSDFNIIPLFHHLDRVDWEEGVDLQYARGLTTVFEVTFDTSENMSLPLELSLAVSGVEFTTTSEFIEKEGNPRIFVQIEPDYTSSETSDYNPFSVTYILPIDTTTGRTPNLKIAKGFMCGYEGETSVPTKVFKRYVRVVLPLGKLHKVKAFPLTTALIMRRPSDDDSELFTALPISAATSPTYNTRQSNWQHPVNDVQASSLDFSILGDGLQYDSVVVQYIGVKYRLKQSQGVPGAISCDAEYRRCYNKYSTEYYRSKTRTCTNNRCCSTERDNDVDIWSTAVEQHRLDLQMYRGKYEDSGEKRRYWCNGVGIVTERPLVRDFSDMPTDQEIIAENDKVESRGYSRYTAAGLGEVITHTVYQGSKIVGYTETYSVDDRFATWKIIVLALIPLYIAVLVGIGILIFCLIKRLR